MESLGRLAITLGRQGYLDLDEPAAEITEHLKTIGAEWLGEDHVAVQCLHLGIGLHHGLLPRQFLGEIERLARQGDLAIVIASPTVAQGLELSGSALVFHSIYRSGELLEPREFSNVVGRVGRAFVDLDGLAVLPVFGSSRKERFRITAFAGLQQQAGSQDLESGVVLLIQGIVQRLAAVLKVSEASIAEYVLNQGDGWDRGLEAAQERAEVADLSDAALGRDLLLAVDELDTAIFGTIENLDEDPNQLAEALDTALRSSLWARRLYRGTAEQRQLQKSLLESRAHWLWQRTSPNQRRAFYWAGVGYRAGRQLYKDRERLFELLQRSEDGLTDGDLAVFIDSVSELARAVLPIYPFKPRSAGELPPDWPGLLENWIRGIPTAVFAGSADAHEFIYDRVVYRLVWAVEAVRLLRVATAAFGEEAPSGQTALILTHGVPNVAAGILMQAGLTSRTLATRLVREFTATFTDFQSLDLWLDNVRDDERLGAVLRSGAERQEWTRFVSTWTEHLQGTWRELELTVPVEWTHSRRPPDGARVRAVQVAGTEEPLILGADLAPLGRITRPIQELRRGFSEARVSNGSTTVTLGLFAPYQGGRA